MRIKRNRGVVLAAILIATSAVPALAASETLECNPDGKPHAFHNLYVFDYDAKTVRYYLADDDGAEVKMPISTSGTGRIKISGQQVTFSEAKEGMSISSILDRTTNSLSSKMHMSIGGETIDAAEHVTCTPWVKKN